MIETSLQQKLNLVSIETQFQQILQEIDQKKWTFQSLMEALQGKGYPLLIAFLSIPFCLPIPIPGLSIPFGLVIALLGLRMAYGRDLWGSWVLKKELSSKTLKILIDKSLRLFKMLKPLFRLRWSRLCSDSFFYRLHGFFIIFLGLNLALPFPIPFGNFLFAWPLLFLGLGLTENDGLWVCLSYLVAIGGTSLFIYLLVLFFSSWIY